MIDISTTEILTNVKLFRDPDINFPKNKKFQNPKFLIPTSLEETPAILVKLALEAGAYTGGRTVRAPSPAEI